MGGSTTEEGGRNTARSTHLFYLLGRFIGKFDLLQSLRVVRQHVNHVDVTKRQTRARIGQIENEFVDDVTAQFPVQRLMFHLQV